MSVSVTYIVTQSMDKRAYSFKSSATYQAGGAISKRSRCLWPARRLWLMTREVTFRPLSQTSSLTIKTPPLTGDEAWGNWQHTPMTWWQCPLNFAVWCATFGCGVSADDHLQAKDPLLASLYRFHIYYATRRLLVELKVALSRDQSHSWYQNAYDARAYKQLCTEF